MKRNVLVCGAALMTILSLALSGCGQNEKPDASQGGAESSESGGGEEVVKFAIASPVTGDSAEYGVHFNVGAQIAADHINAEGGINGKKLVVESFDSKNDAKEATEVARLIAQDSEILATMGDFQYMLYGNSADL